MTPQELASRIDHTILKPEATWEDVQKLIGEAMQYRFAALCVNPVYTLPVRRALAGTGIRTAAVIGFPLGANKPSLKTIEATMAAKDGAEEIDCVPCLPAVMAGDLAAVRDELGDIVRAARSVNPNIVVKVILETALLLDNVSEQAGEERIRIGCQAATEAGCDFVKTSTGFHPAGGASSQSVRLLRKHAPSLSVKASGGIRTCQDALTMIEAGADRLGCSASVAIVQQAEQATA